MTASHVYVGVARWTGGTLGGLFRQRIGEDRWERLNGGLPDDVDVQAVTAHPREPGVLYAGTSKGLWRSRDGGERWERPDFPDPDVQVWAVEICPAEPRRLYAGVSPVGVYRSDDGGDSWRRLPRPAMPERIKMPFACRVMRLAADPRNADHVYATLEVGGAMRSRDGGESWEDCGRGLVELAKQPHLKNRILTDDDAEGMLDGHAVCVSPAEPGAVLLALRTGLFRSDDGGAAWRDLEIGRVSPLTYCRDIRVAPQEPRTLYLCLSPASRSEAGALWRSDDLGRSWRRFDHGVTARSTMMAVGLHPRDPSIVCAASRLGQVFATTDGGASWRETHLPEGCKDVYAVACA